MIARHLDLSSIEDYRYFLRVKALPAYRFAGRVALVSEEYADRLGMERPPSHAATDYRPIPGLFDYQRDIAALAIRRRKFAAFWECGLGKTLLMLEFARHASSLLWGRRRVLIISPLMVIDQTIAEFKRFYAGAGTDMTVTKVRAKELPDWIMRTGTEIGITNYEALGLHVPQGRLGCLILDESSMLKSAYGKWGVECIRLGRGLDWKLALTGTPAPNDRIEFANHAVFLDVFPTVNSFLARFFVNRGQTDNRWELKPHALRPFYRALSHWCIFLTNPGVYGWKDNAAPLPPINVHIHDVDLTTAQSDAAREATGNLIVTGVGGITTRTKLARIAKGHVNGASVETRKPAFIRSLVDSWPDESTIIWCLYNHEQELMERTFPDAASIAGDTPHERRMELIEDFKAGRRRVLISKPKILGFGLNLHVATRQVFSGLQDSYESFHQAVKRSNRYGSTCPLNVHVPVTELERPMVENVLRKAHRVDQDTREQEEMFRDAAL